MFFTYIHRKVVDNSVFYVGCGNKKRINDFCHRSEHWKQIASKDGVYSETVAKWDSKDEALDHEKLLIDCFNDMGHELVNKPQGNHKHRKMTQNAKDKISLAMSGENHHFYGKKRKPFTKEHKLAMSLAAKARHLKARMN
jgi:hypothetical protein